MRYNPTQAAAYLGISYRQLSRHHKLRRIPFEKEGRRIYYQVRELDKFNARFLK